MMNILVLNGSPRRDGNTAGMVAAFKDAAEEKGHNVTVCMTVQDSHMKVTS